jgi:hypothetical protein
MKKYRYISAVNFFGDCVYYIQKRVFFISWEHVTTAHSKEERDKFLKHLNDE